jgi:hypothetical protein
MQIATCFEKNAVSDLGAMVGNLFTWGSGAGTIINGLGAVGNLGQAVQRVTELVVAATPVETAVIAITPGSAVVNRSPRSVRSPRLRLRQE